MEIVFVATAFYKNFKDYVALWYKEHPEEEHKTRDGKFIFADSQDKLRGPRYEDVEVHWIDGWQELRYSVVEFLRMVELFGKKLEEK